MFYTISKKYTNCDWVQRINFRKETWIYFQNHSGLSHSFLNHMETDYKELVLKIKINSITSFYFLNERTFYHHTRQILYV